MKAVYPFAAIVGQDDLKLALLIAAVDQGVGGVLVFGDRGTGKSTAVRALADLLPKRPVVEGCAFNCAPKNPAGLCGRCAPAAKTARSAALKTRQAPHAGGGFAVRRHRGPRCGRARHRTALTTGEKSV
jgi:magnesium chelatase subunit I